MTQPGYVPPVLTLIEGDARATFEQHPTETARRWLMTAAEVEEGWVAEVMLQFASALPYRHPWRV